jgi:hypothetical protein
VEWDKSVSVTLASGTAEIYGFELAPKQPFRIETAAKLAVRFVHLILYVLISIYLLMLPILLVSQRKNSANKLDFYPCSSSSAMPELRALQVFTYHGCVVEIEGEVAVSYTASEVIDLLLIPSLMVHLSKRVEVYCN